jgi:hypothetical protein
VPLFLQIFVMKSGARTIKHISDFLKFVGPKITRTGNTVIQTIPSSQTHKIWERTPPKNGYVHEFHIYTGRVAGGQPEEGLGSRVIKDLSCKLEGKNHVVYMDNFLFEFRIIPTNATETDLLLWHCSSEPKRYARSYKSS